MKSEEFRVWLAQADELTPSQRQQAIDHLSRKQQPDEVIGAIVGPHPDCPRCHQAGCGRWGNAHGLPRYRCGARGRTFNALTGTPLAHLRHRECGSEYARSMIVGETVRAAARSCGVHKNTFFRWRHRFLSRLAQTPVPEAFARLPNEGIARLPFAGVNLDRLASRQKGPRVITGLQPLGLSHHDHPRRMPAPPPSGSPQLGITPPSGSPVIGQGYP